MKEILGALIGINICLAMVIFVQMMNGSWQKDPHYNKSMSDTDRERQHNKSMSDTERIRELERELAEARERIDKLESRHRGLCRVQLPCVR
jgi:5-bromo-4-chloroindolyl phosphate hydrolysis protein